MITQVAAMQAWSVIETMFSSQTDAHASNTCFVLATAHKDNQSVVEYIGKMKTLSDEMVAAG